MEKITALTIALFLMLSSYSQKPGYVYQGYIDSDEQLNPKKLSKWVSKDLSAYNGIYHFGESEAEWDLLVIAYDSSLVLQTFSNNWGRVDNSESETWRKSV